MAIKVKHEGNVTSRAVAGAIGGQARRNAEDSKALSQRAAQENMAANRQLSGAHASPASPGHASAQLGHAPSLSAHAPTPTLATARMMNPVLAERAETQQALKDQSAEEEARRRQEEWDRQHGILRQERDADLIAAGTHEYGYSPEAQREYDRIVKEYNDGRGKRFKVGSPEDKQFMAERDRQIAALPKTLVQRKDPEGLFRNNTFTDEQGRIFTTDGKLMYNPADAETRRMEFQQRQMDAEEKRYMDAVMRLQQGYRTAEPVYKMDVGGEEPLVDASGNPIVEKWNSVYKPYTPEQQEAILRRLFPSRFADVQPEPAAQQPSPFQQALQSWWQGMRGGGAGAQPAAQPAPTGPAPTPTAQPASQAQPVIRQDSQGVSWEVVFDENGKPIGKRRVRQ